MKNSLAMLIIALFSITFKNIYTQTTGGQLLKKADVQYLNNLLSEKPAGKAQKSYTNEIPQYIRAPEPEPKSWSETITSGFKSIGSGILTGLGFGYVLTEKLLSSLWSGIKALPSTLVNAFKSIASSLSGAFNTAVELGTQAKEFVVKAATPYLKQIGTWLGQFSEWSTEKITQAAQLTEQFAEYSKKEIIDPAIKAATPYVLSGLEKLGVLLQKSGELLLWAGANLKAAGEKLWPYIVKLGNGIKFIAEVGFDLLKQGFQNLLVPGLKGLGNGMLYVGNGLLDFGSKALDIGWTIITKVSSTLKEPLFKLLNGALDILVGIAKFSQQAFTVLAKYYHIIDEKLDALIISGVKAFVNFGSALLDVVIALGNAALEKGKPRAEWAWAKLTQFFWFLVELGKELLSFGSEMLSLIVEKSKPTIIASAKRLQALVYKGYLQAHALYEYAIEAGTPWVTWAVDKALAAYEYALEAGSNMLAAASEHYRSAQASVSKQLDEINIKLQEWRKDITHMRAQLDAKIKGIKVSLGFEVPQEATATK